MNPAAILTGAFAPSCVANPSAFTDGLTVGALAVLALLAVGTWRTRHRR